MEGYLKESVLQHENIEIPVKVIKVYWAINEAYVQGVDEKTFMVRADNLNINKK